MNPLLLVGGPRRFAAGGLVNGCNQFAPVDTFHQISGGSGMEAVGEQACGIVKGMHQHRQRRAQRFDFPQRVDSRILAERYIQQNEREGLTLHSGNRFVRCRGLNNVAHAGCRKHKSKRFANGVVIIDDQQWSCRRETVGIRAVELVHESNSYWNSGPKRTVRVSVARRHPVH